MVSSCSMFHWRTKESRMNNQWDFSYFYCGLLIGHFAFSKQVQPGGPRQSSLKMKTVTFLFPSNCISWKFMHQIEVSINRKYPLRGYILAHSPAEFGTIFWQVEWLQIRTTYTGLRAGGSKQMLGVLLANMSE